MNSSPHEHKARVLPAYPRTSVPNKECTNKENVAIEDFTHFQTTHLFLLVDSTKFAAHSLGTGHA
jgi:hypothetical protein